MSTRDPLLEIMDVDREEGLWLALQDETRWIVAPDDAPVSAGWTPEMRVKIDPSGDADYPYALTNVDTPEPEIVRAQPVD